MEKRVKIYQILKNQLPEFIKEEYPLITEFLSQYYLSLETQSNTYDIIQNIDQYVKIDNLTNLVETTKTTSDIEFFDDVILVESTSGFPESYGLLQIDDEIITYTGITENSFTGCIRGFSGVTSYRDTSKTDQLVFSTSESTTHTSGTVVKNLSILFLKEFFKKIKILFTPGFENQEFYEGLNESLFIKQSNDFYQSKGTDASFKILFGALYGESVEVIRPRDFLIQPSDAQYRIFKDLVVEAVEGNPLDLVNSTLRQDQTNFTSLATGTIAKVEEIVRNGNKYYIISLDYDYNRDITVKGTVQSEFSIHPKTYITNDISTNSTFLDVDSTVGFPNQGEIIINLDNGTTLTITYTEKTLTQFLNCTGITNEIPNNSLVKLNSYAYGYYGINRDQIVKVRINGIIENLEINKKENNFLHEKGNSVEIKTLGNDDNSIKANNWIFNIPVTYDVETITQESPSTYRVTLYDSHSLVKGDLILLNDINCIVETIQNKKTLVISPEIEITELNNSFKLKKIISKCNFNNYPQLNIINSNIQNVYWDLDSSYYVTSNSLPNYLNEINNVRTNTISIFNLTPINDELSLGQHYFYTGDIVIFIASSGNVSNISTNVYYVKKINNTTIKLARSRENIFLENYVNITGSVSGTISSFDFVRSNFTLKQLKPQKIIRKLSPSIAEETDYETKFGPTGIFVNGVELLNYKSKDSIFYGPIEKIIPVSSGKKYDIINPPLLTIEDTNGSGAEAYCSVTGNLERIDVVDSGFDYLEQPFISITGGNGSGAVAEANLTEFIHTVSLNAENTSLLDFNNNIIGFSTFHKFKSVEEVVYDTQGQKAIVGLVTNSTYFVKPVDISSIQLYKSIDDVIAGINTIPILGIGEGIHLFKSKIKKKKISSITINNSGINYSNKKRTVLPVGINTAFNSIIIKDHGYKDGEIIRYDATNIPISGLTSSSSYYVNVISPNEFRLANIGLTTEQQDFYYKTKQFVDLTSSGTGYHIFNYPPIQVKVIGRIGVDTSFGGDFNAVVSPVFRGEIESVFIQNGGDFYGSNEIINFPRQPNINLISGSNAEIIPIISPQGSIVDVTVQSGGSNYNSQPDLVINGNGTGAKLVPIVSSNGRIVDVKIINGGVGYSPTNTTIQVVTPGEGAKFEAKIKSWSINLVNQLNDNGLILDDGGVLYPGINSGYELEYFHLYPSNKLRSIIYGRTFNQGVEFFTPDIQNDTNIEVNLVHSPIIGWAYDGNPIYGPYGFTSPQGNSPIKALRSGYKLNSSQTNRPSVYPLGFFVNDYVFTASGDLDEYNGRYCVTPEFPDGTYAYFCTLDENKNPEFPYVIGNKFHSTPNEFNFNSSSNQDYINLNKTNWIRNTTPYNLISNRSQYDYILNIKNNNIKIAEISNVSKGAVSTVGIITSGNNYKVNDTVVFTNTNNVTTGKVVEIKGKTINQIGVGVTFFNNVEFIPINNSRFIGIYSSPHNLNTDDIITVSNKNERNLSSSVKVNQNSLIITSGIGTTGTTGIITYFNVSGFLDFPNIKENDIYKIVNEEVKILEIDKASSRIKVLRNQNNINGITSYTSGTQIIEKPRKFEVNLGITTVFYNYQLNKEFYFNPSETLALGVTGITSTLYFNNPGVGVTIKTIPIQTIYLPNHNLITNTELIYSNNQGTSISVSNDKVNSFTLQDKSSVYCIKINEDLIGLSTNRISVGPTGNIIGIGTSSNILYFTGIGSGVNHSFTTNYENILKANVYSGRIRVSTASSHGLSLNDTVNISVKSGITTVIKVQYNDYNQRMIVNPKNIESISLTDNAITIQNHGYATGDKIIYTSSSVIGGLQHNKMYYVVVLNKDEFQLSSSYYDATNNNVNIINLVSIGSGVISQINPQLYIRKNQTVVFDLSDSSLSYISNSLKSAFDFDLYKDSRYKNKFLLESNSNSLQVVKTGQIGITSSAKLTLSINDSTPEKLYYKLTPINLEDNISSKINIVYDNEQVNNNQINIIKSVYSGNKIINGITANTFDFNISNEIPETSLYNLSNSSLYYTTTSTTAKGPIHKIEVSNNKNYNKLPVASKIETNEGSGAIVEATTDTIGKFNRVTLKDIGYDYPTDYTVRPKANIPQILKIETLSIIDKIEVISGGNNYTTAPNLIVLDGITNNIVDDVELLYNNADNTVNIIKNTKGINNVNPKILPINNSNGIGIEEIIFNNESKDVIITLQGTFTQSPFSVNDKILIESVNVNSLIGYNSEDYNYSFFTVTNVGVSTLGISTVTYNLSEFLSPNEIPGIYDNTFITGKVVNSKDLAIFNASLTKNPFLDGELVTSNGIMGIIENTDPNIGYITVISNDIFTENATIRGKASKTTGRILKVYSNDSSFYTVSSSSISKKGWDRETGFLNNSLQRMPDNDYYQYFSYSLKSQVEYEKWNEIVSTLNHTSGFKKFSDLIVISSIGATIGVPTSFSGVDDVFVEIDSVVDINCVNNFDNATETSVLFPSGYRSGQVYMKNVALKDYFEMVGNRVLLIDDISENFNGATSSFELKSGNNPIFKRNFVGSAVSITSNSISIPNHFFITGEEIAYISPIDGSGIGIGTTFITGIGVTNILPPTIYVVKENDSSIRVSASSSDALLTIPITLELLNVGTGTTHTLLAKKQNTKTLITVDNIIQTPIVSTAITTITTTLVGITTNIIPVSGISTIVSGNYVKINDEIMKINASYDNNTFEVVRGVLGTGISTHNSGSIVRKVKGNYNIVDNYLYFSGSPNGKIPEETLLPDEIDFSGIATGSSFSGRVFLRSGVPNTSITPYDTNYIFDDISNQFNGFEDTFTLTSNFQNITGFSTGNSIVTLNNVIQSPNGFNFIGGFSLNENVGVTSITFTGTASSVTYDVNNASVPRGGIIVSVGSTQGLGYQPLVSAGGTAIVSIAGTIRSISIGNSGSGYRSGLQTVNVGVKTGDVYYTVGIASIINGNVVGVSITNPGLGYTQTSPPEVVFDAPLSYSNIPLIYSTSGVGTEARVDIVVSQDTSILSFELSNLGFGYNIGDILTIPVGGTTGIPTTGSVFNKFQITVDRIYNDDFTGWYPGDFKVFDPLDRYFNGTRRTFPIRLNNVPQTIANETGVTLDPQASLLLFINDVLQVPGKDYTFNGSLITLSEAPTGSIDGLDGDKSKLLYYSGTADIDVIFKNSIETIKSGDDVTLIGENIEFKQNERQIVDITSPVILETEVYFGPGINTNDSYVRPLNWCRQTNDKIINSKIISKNREIYEPLIYPVTNIITNVGITTTEIFVESVKTFFDNANEGPTYNVIVQTIDDSNVATVELIEEVSYEGDFGIITGIKTTTYEGNNALIFDFYIPPNSYLRDVTVNNPSITESQILQNYYFVISNSNVGGITTSRTRLGSIIGVSSYIDNIYQVSAVSIGQTNVRGQSGLVNVAKVTVKAEYTGLTGIGFSNYYGDFSWGRLSNYKRTDPKNFVSYNSNGYVGIQTSPIVYRASPLKYQDYTS